MSVPNSFSVGAGRPIPERRPLPDSFAAQLPPLEDNHAQNSPPSFKGFLTENKKNSPSVLNTGDIWKPKLPGTQSRAPTPGAFFNREDHGTQYSACSITSFCQASDNQICGEIQANFSDCKSDLKPQNAPASQAMYEASNPGYRRFVCQQ